MSGVHDRSQMPSDDSSEMMQETTHEMDMTHGHGSGVMSHENMLPLGLFSIGFLILAGVLLVRSSPINRFVKGTVLSSLFSKKVLGLSVFIMLTGGMAIAANQLKPAASTMDMHEGHDMSNMSHDEMMAVDGSFNATPVTVEVIKPQLLEASVRYTGSINPYLEVTVYPRVSGQLTDYSVYPGDRVSAGQELAYLDAAELLTEVAEAIAETDSMQVSLDMSKIEVDEQRSQIEQIEADLDYLNKKLERFDLLVREGAISQDDFDIVESEVNAKQASLREATVKLSRLETKLIYDRTRLKQAEAKTRTASIMEGYTTIKSPISGIVQERMADPGVVVQPGMGILKIGDYKKVRLQANVAQQDAIAIRVGSPIIATVPGTEIELIRGRITSIFPQTDNQTRTVTVEAVVDNPGEQLLSGQFLEMEIITDRKPAAISVPQTAIFDFKDEPAVWVVESDVARRKTVALGMRSGDRIEISSGLEPGDAVIVAGNKRLMESSPVTVINDEEYFAANTSNRPESNVEIKLINPREGNSVKMGDTQLLIEVKSTENGQSINVENLDIAVLMPMKNMAPMRPKVEVKPDDKPNHFQIHTYLGMRGAWNLSVKVKDSQYQERAEFSLDVQ